MHHGIGSAYPGRSTTHIPTTSCIITTAQPPSGIPQEKGNPGLHKPEHKLTRLLLLSITAYEFLADGETPGYRGLWQLGGTKRISYYFFYCFSIFLLTVSP